MLVQNIFLSSFALISSLQNIN